MAAALRLRLPRLLAGAAAATLGGVAVVAYRYRPRPSTERDFHEQLAFGSAAAAASSPSPATEGGAPPARGRNRLLPESALERALYALGGTLTVAICSNLGWLLLNATKAIEVLGRERLDELAAARPRVPRARATARPVTAADGADWLDSASDDEEDEDAEDDARAGAGADMELSLLTVGNHNSMLDDPGLTSAIFDLRTRLDHARMRWGICTEEICFGSAPLSAYFGLGKAVPVQRGGSIHQKGVAEMQRALNRGEWVHIFPEGKTWQEGGLPSRDEEGRWCSNLSGSGRCGPPWERLGPPKWGVGKLIANSRRTPIVLPYFHLGMSELVPQDGANKVITGGSLLSLARRVLLRPAQVTLKVGAPVHVQDVLDDYYARALQRALARAAQRRLRPRPLEAAEAATAQALVAAAGASSWLWRAWLPADKSATPFGVGAGTGADAKARAAMAASISSPSPEPLPAPLVRKARWAESGSGCALALLDSTGAGEGTGMGMGAGTGAETGAPQHRQRQRIVPTRTLKSGVVVPAFVDAPLRARPPDHALLTPDERAAEDLERLALYAALTERVWGALRTLHDEVRAHREAKGLVEWRNMTQTPYSAKDDKDAGGGSPV